MPDATRRGAYEVAGFASRLTATSVTMRMRRHPGDAASARARGMARARDTFVVDAAVLALPIGSAFAEYNRQATDLARAELERLPLGPSPPTDVVPQVIHLIRTHLAEGAFDLERTAREIGIGARTLQRRLQNVGISFSSLRDQVRSEAALVLIRRADVSIDELADRLGYAERSNFTHAFSRWTGMTPGAFQDGAAAR